MKIIATNNALLFNSRRLGSVVFGLIIMALVLLASVEPNNAQRVYGVSATRHTTVVAHGGSTAVVRRTTVVAAPARGVAVLPHGYIAVLPVGYRVVGGGIFIAGSVRYRATFYNGRTVYIRL